MLEILQERIEQGFYPVGRRLPSERKLAAEFQVPQSQDALIEQVAILLGFFRHKGETPSFVVLSPMDRARDCGRVGPPGRVRTVTILLH